MVNWEQRKETREHQGDDDRDGYEIDYARVVHSASFRRLQGKTQILNLGDSDFYRTRLTHSMEVSQVATGILQRFRKKYEKEDIFSYLPTTTLIRTICLVHDLGHPPFGHGGEVALNFCMRKNNGFEGNGQTLRILSRLEKFSKNCGSNLTRRSLLGTLKYPAPYSKVNKSSPKLTKTYSGDYLLNCKASKPPKCYLDSEEDIVKWILQEFSPNDKKQLSTLIEKGSKLTTKYKSLDCSIMELADDISYGVHDLEDAIALGLITRKQFLKAFEDKHPDHFLRDLTKRYPEEFPDLNFILFVNKLFNEGKARKRQISRLVHYFITNTVKTDCKSLFQEPLLRFNANIKSEARIFLEELKDLVKKLVILSPNVQHLEFKGQQMVIKVFDTLAHDPKSFLPTNTYEKYIEEGEDIRVICDHISGMTDHFLLRTYERLFSPRMGSVFDKL